MCTVNGTEVLVLRSVAQGDKSLYLISKKINKSLSRTSTIVKQLEIKGFLVRSREGIGYNISFSDHSFISDLIPLLREGDRRIECILDSGMHLLSIFLGETSELSKEELIVFSGLSQSTVRDFLNKAIRVTVLNKQGKYYHISRSSRRIRDFVQGYSAYATGKVLAKIVSKGMIHWKLGFDFIYSTLERPDDRMTGPTAFKEQGISFATDRNYFHSSPFSKPIGMEVNILDNIVMDQNEPRNIVNSAIFLRKRQTSIDMRLLRLLSRIYGIEESISNILTFVEGGSDEITGIIDRREFEDRYRTYE